MNCKKFVDKITTQKFEHLNFENVFKDIEY